MNQNIYFKNKKDAKKKVCELIDRNVEFSVKEDCITIKKRPNIHVLYKCESGFKEGKFYIEGTNMLELIEGLYSTINFKKEFGEIGMIISVGIIE